MNIVRILFIPLVLIPVIGQGQFITTWKTDNPGTLPDQITIPTTGSDYYYMVDWVDTSDPLNTGTVGPFTGDATIIFPSSGTYEVSITGDFPRIYFNDSGDKEKILSVDQWGNNPWTSMYGAFYGCTNLSIPASDAPNLSQATTLAKMFRNCVVLNDPMDHWNVSTITDMHTMFFGANSFNQSLNSWDIGQAITLSSMFEGATAFNGDVSNWNTGNVLDLRSIFKHAQAFNRNISGWDVGSVTHARNAFESASSFNQPIGAWNVSNVVDMAYMFQNASSFDQPIGMWDMSKVRNTKHMFYGATAFNQAIGAWNVSNVIDMSLMFTNASSFNQSLNGWNVSNVKTMASMFLRASAFNQNISGWDVSNVTNMAAMFKEALVFDQDISSWNVIGVTKMDQMFNRALAFNQPIGLWSVHNVATMSQMFRGAESFNQSLDEWNVSSVTNMSNMFRQATSFDQYLGSWDMENVTDLSYFFYYSGLSTLNYSFTLDAWNNASNLPANLILHAHGLSYCMDHYRNGLVNNHGWTITGDTKASEVCDFPPVRNVRATLNSKDQVEFNWEEPAINTDFVVQYQVQRSVDNATSFQLQSSLTSPYHVDSTIAVHSDYYYSIRYTTALGTSIDSDTLSVSIPNRTPVLNSSLSDVSMKYNETLTVEIQVSDGDGDIISFASSDFPSFMTLVDNGDNTASIQINPSSEDEGFYPHLTVIMNDNYGGVITNTFNLTITLSEPDPEPIDPTLSHEGLYNGNISAMRWKGVNDEEEQLFTYSYDGLNRLSSAQYASKRGSTYSANQGYYSIPQIEYDLNGNIQSLTRQGQNTNKNADIIDQLTYAYGVGASKSNQLLSVTDDRGSVGFKDGNKTGDDYAYDDNGNMTKDLNKDIINISYNYLNLPERVDFQNGDHIEYLYDAAGIKLQQRVFEGGVLKKTTDYIGEYIYEDHHDGNGRQLQLIQHEEGRIIPNSTFEGGIQGGVDYQYHLKDHLGNVRVTFSTTPEYYDRTATFEDDKVTEESAEFGNVDVSRVPHPATTNSGKAARLNNAIPAGPYAVIQVNKGDTVNLSVSAYYEGGTGYSNAIGEAAMIDALSTALTSAPQLDGIATAAIDNGIGSAITALGVGGSTDDLIPGAYLNYLIFDREMNYQNIAGFVQISGAANFNEETIAINEIIAEQEGIIIAYLSNESNSTNYVYFDNFNVYHGKTNVVQSDDYYPFGLQFGKYQRTASTPNQYLFNQGFGETTFQGEEGKTFRTERVFELGVDMTKYRMYDYAIGRFLNIDPLADADVNLSFTPYTYSFNNPIRYNDPMGDCVTGDCETKVAEGVTKVEGSSLWKGLAQFGNLVKGVLSGDVQVLFKGSGSNIDNSGPSMDPNKTTQVVDMDEAGELNDLLSVMGDKSGPKPNSLNQQRNTGKKDSKNPKGDQKVAQNTTGATGDAMNAKDQVTVVSQELKATSFEFNVPLPPGTTTSGSSPLPAKPDSLRERRSYRGLKLIKKDTLRVQ